MIDMPSRDARNRRGATMLMVLATLGVGTVIATAFLASRDNSGLVGENITDAASGRTLAVTGLEIGITVLQTEADWRTVHVAGKLLDDFVLADGAFDLDLVDLETGDPPTDATTVVELTCTAVVDGVEQIATAEVTVLGIPGTDDTPVPVDLPEFAVFADHRISLTDDSTITRWSTAPLSAKGERLHIGTTATTAGSVTLQTNAAAIDTTLYHGPGASASLISNATGPEIQTVETLDPIPLLDPPVSGAAPPSGTVYADLEPSAPTAVVADTRYETVTTQAPGTVITAQGDIEVVVEGDLTLGPSSGMTIDGDVTLVVYGNVTMNSESYIELTDGSKLTMYVHGKTSMTDAYIGDVRADKSDRDASGKATWMEPERVTMYSSSVDQVFRLQQNSVVKGTMYLPKSKLSIADDSALYGRVASKELVMANAAGLFYDHSIDTRYGYTNVDSPLYTKDGNIIPEVLALTSLSDAELATLADSTGTVWSRNDTTFGSKTHSEPAVPLSEPTPRPVEVEYTITRTSGDIEAWEAKAVAAFGG